MKERKMLLAKYKAHKSRFDDEIKSLRLKLDTVEKQLEKALQNESRMNQMINKQELTIKSDVRFKKVDILEKENGELVYKLHQSEEQASEKEYELREHKLHCNKTIEKLKTNIARLEIQIEELKKTHSEKEIVWSEEQHRMERKQKQHWIALEEEKLNSKLQVASVQKVKDVELCNTRNSYFKYRTRYRDSEKKVQQLQREMTIRLSKDIKKYDEASKNLKSNLLESEKLLMEKTKTLDIHHQAEKSILKKVNKYKEECKQNQKQICKISKENEKIKTDLGLKNEKVRELQEQIEQLILDKKDVFEGQSNKLDKIVKDQETLIKKHKNEIERLKYELHEVTTQNQRRKVCSCNNKNDVVDPLEIQSDEIINVHNKEAPVKERGIEYI